MTSHIVDKILVVTAPVVLLVAIVLMAIGF